MDQMPAPSCAPTNVRNLSEVRQSAGSSRRLCDMKSENPADSQVLTFPHVRFSKARRQKTGEELERAVDARMRAEKRRKAKAAGSLPTPMAAADLANVYEKLSFSLRSTISEMIRNAARPQRGDDEWYAAMGARIRAARIERGISEEEAARAAGRRVDTWRKYEATGRGRLTYAVLAFADTYGISLNALIRDPE